MTTNKMSAYTLLDLLEQQELVVRMHLQKIPERPNRMDAVLYLLTGCKVQDRTIMGGIRYRYGAVHGRYNLELLFPKDQSNTAAYTWAEQGLAEWTDGPASWLTRYVTSINHDALGTPAGQHRIGKEAMVLSHLSRAHGLLFATKKPDNQLEWRVLDALMHRLEGLIYSEEGQLSIN